MAPGYRRPGGLPPARPRPTNRPGLPALDARVGDHASLRQTLIARLTLCHAENSALAGLTTRAPGDFTLGLLDAWASAGDVLAFYQERIANEGFLRTATERRSVLELARAVGYELRPGVAAGVHLVFTVEDAPGAPGLCTIAAGSPIQSVPPQGKLPQVFETSAELLARFPRVFVTGGSARSPLIKAFIQQKLPKVPLEGGDDFGSVASGLARYAERLFAD